MLQNEINDHKNKINELSMIKKCNKDNNNNDNDYDTNDEKNDNQPICTQLPELILSNTEKKEAEKGEISFSINYNNSSSNSNDDEHDEQSK